MTRKSRILSQLVMLSRELGRPAHRYVTLGEGNTSAAIDTRTFWIKASGIPLHGIQRTQFVEVPFVPLLGILDDQARESQVPLSGVGLWRPSIEALFHAVVLQWPGIRFVGHTHPTAVNRLLCTRGSRALFQRRLFPDEAVYCGVAPVYVPYQDPGVPLARAIRQQAETYRKRYREIPRLILLENHGIIAVGNTPQDVLRITTMAVKASEILWGARLIASPRYLTASQAAHLARRPDEQYRRRLTP